MWALWIVITLIVFGVSATQLFSCIYVYINMGAVYKELSRAKKKSLIIATIIHSAILLTWLFLCIFIDAINRYWILMLIVWIVEIIFTMCVVKKSAIDLFFTLSEDVIEQEKRKRKDLY